MAVSGKFRRGKITSPVTANLKDISFDGADKFDRRTADDDMWCKMPVKLKEEGTMKATLVAGDLLGVRNSIQNVDVTVTVEDVAFTAGVETVTTRTFTLKNATANVGASADNDGGESSGSLSVEFGRLQ